MSIESALASKIQLIPEVAAIISNRVYPVVAPQNSATPFVIYKRVPEDTQYTQSGESNLQKARFEVSAVCETYEQAIDLAEKLRAGLSGKRGILGDGSAIFSQGPSDDWNRESGLFVRMIVLRIQYQAQSLA
jgi:hypothetical protein